MARVKAAARLSFDRELRRNRPAPAIPRLRRRHRTTLQVVGASWAAERPQLRQISARILAATAGEALRAPLPVVVDLAARLSGEHVEVRALSDYEVAL